MERGSLASESQALDEQTEPADRPLGAAEPTEEDPAARIRQLERANRELLRVNSALARSQIGKRDAAAASLLIRLRHAEKEVARMEHSISWRITAPLRVFKPVFVPLARRLRARRARRAATQR